MKLNYFLSGWIANLGVVPLFSFAFFLTLPVDLTLFFLIILVCLVRDPILYPLSIECYSKNTLKFLSLLALVVKVFVITAPNLYAASELVNSKDIFLSKGEQTELKLKSLKSFSVGNDEVIKYRYLPSKGQLILKAKSIGFSDLVVWDQQNTQFKYRIYITSKRDQLKKMELVSSIDDKNIEVSLNGGLTYITGSVDTLKTYNTLKYLQSLKKSDISLNIELENGLRNEIYKEVYERILQKGIQYIYCECHSINIKCEYKNPEQLDFDTKSLEEKFKIEFINLTQNYSKSNLKLKFNIITIDSNQAFLHKSGIDQVQFNLQELINRDKLNLISEDARFQGNNFNTKVLSSQVVLATLNNPFDISIGAEIPFRSLSGDTEIINWKYSGLKIHGHPKEINKILALQYVSQLTNPTKDSITGPRAKSTLFISSGKTQLLYSSRIQTTSVTESGVPLLMEIPILKNLFISKDESLNIKTILCFVTLLEENNE